MKKILVAMAFVAAPFAAFAEGSDADVFDAPGLIDNKAGQHELDFEYVGPEADAFVEVEVINTEEPEFVSGDPSEVSMDW